MNRLVYISGALTTMTEEERARLRALYEEIAKVCEGKGLTPYLPHRHSDPSMAARLSPQDVYVIDQTAVSKSRLVICYTAVPSFGPGMEVMMAHYAGIPVILLNHKPDGEAPRVSRLIRGCPAIFMEISFADTDDMRRKLADGLVEFIERWESLPLPEPLKLFHKGL